MISLRKARGKGNIYIISELRSKRLYKYFFNEMLLNRMNKQVSTNIPTSPFKISELHDQEISKLFVAQGRHRTDLEASKR